MEDRKVKQILSGFGTSREEGEHKKG
jgi:hypothetical protein